MTKKQKPRFGQLEPQYNFALNPYPDVRMSKCPNCEQKTKQRKLPLLIHVDPRHLIALNYTCRYCPDCDLLIAHQDQIEDLLAGLFAQRDPSVIGNDYLIIGTVERKAWRENMEQPKPFAEAMAQTHDFKSHSTIQMSRAGWFPEGVKPPLWEPPPPTVWVKRKALTPWPPLPTLGEGE
jgi:hypothetical protein